MAQPSRRATLESTDRTRPQATREELSRLRSFQGVASSALEALLAPCPVRELEVGEVLIAVGEASRTLYFVLDGLMRIHLENLKTEPINFVQTGECVGEISVIDEKPASAFVVADVPTKLLAVEHDLFWALTNANPVIARNLLFGMSQKLRANNDTVRAVRQQAARDQQQALFDALTNLHNRRWFEGALSRQMQRAQREDRPLALLMIDIDHFKRFNDEFGHAAGDVVLQHVARHLRSRSRPTDLVARWGGEEFVALLPDTAREEALAIAGRLRESIATLTVQLPDKSVMPPVTMSLGLACLAADETAERFFARADGALYRAKNAGRNRVSA
jgi:diguanylate cyclase (GGDEF)-like protein